MRRQRGSAYLFVVICAAVMGLTLAALIPLVSQSRTTQTRRLRATKVELTINSLVEQVEAEALSNPIVLGSSRSVTLNGVTATGTIADGAATVPNGYLLSGTATINATGDTYKISRYVTKGASATPYSFALYTATDMTYSGTIVTGASSADGDVFVNGKVSYSGSGITINGNLSAQKTITLASGATVTGTQAASATAIAMPTFNSTDYYNAATYRLNGFTTTSGATFPGPTSGQYPIYYITGSMSFSGSISGCGTVFVQGDVTITGNVAYTSSTDELAIIVQGNLTIQSGCSQMAGLIFVTGQVNVQSASLTIPRGCIIANSIPTASGTIRVTRDNVYKNSSTAGYNMSLPGYWP